MSVRARDETLLEIAGDYGWSWAYGPDLDKGHRHQLHWEGYLAKKAVTPKRIRGARGAMLNAMAFGITLDGCVRLMKIYPDEHWVKEMKLHVFRSLFTSVEWVSEVIRDRDYKYKRLQ